MILKVKVPLESSKDTREYQEGLDSTPVDKLQLGSVGNPGNTTGAIGAQNIVKNERIQVELQINHQGEVNRARYMPQ